MKTKLNKRSVEAIEVFEKDQKVFDTEIPGFHVRVKPSGIKTYALRYRHQGRQRTIAIGRHGSITAGQARKRARELISAVSHGADPSFDRKLDSKALTFTKFWPLYLERHALPRKTQRSVEEDKRLWRLHLKQAFGSYRISALTSEDVYRLHSRLSEVPASANRCLCLLSKMMNLAIEWGYAEANPCRAVKKYRETPRERFLSNSERQRLASALQQEADQAGAVAIWLCILTGARRGEVLQARWEQFRFDQDLPVWEIPASITKQRRSNRKPLSKQAVILLTEWRERSATSASCWVIPGRDPENRRFDLNGPWNRTRKRAGLDGIRLHDLRHDFASQAVAEGWSLEIIGKYLGHSSIQTTQRYAHLLDDPLAAMAERIGQTYAKGDL